MTSTALSFEFDFSISYQNQASVHEAEGSRPPDAGRAVHDRGADVRLQAAAVPHGLQELQEGVGAGRDPEVGPGGVVKVLDLPAVARATRVRQPELADGVVGPRYRMNVLHFEFDVLEEHVVADLPGPVLVALLLALLHDPVEHEDGFALLLPDHEPEVADSRSQGT